MVLGLADNFYNGPLTTEDPRWQKEFSSMYNFTSDFHTCMGNHDYCGSVAAQQTFSTDSRWHAYVNGTLVFPEADLTVVFVDTPRACPSYMSAPYGDCNENCMLQLANLTDGMPCTNTTSLPCWLSHMGWLNATLAKVTTKWRFVAGHHPITDEHMPYMMPSLNAFGVQAYLAGHVHNLQHLQEKNSRVNYFISGAGAFGSAFEKDAALLLKAQGVKLGTTHQPRTLPHPHGKAWDGANWVGNGPGFLSITLDGEVATGRFFNHEGAMVYNTTFSA